MSLVGWLVVVPLASWLVAPWLVLEADLHPAREGSVLVAYLLLGEAWFYAVHRTLHASKPLFRWFHAHHHRITDPHVVNASYQHPVELVVITMGTAWIGPLLLEGHWSTVSAWCALVMILGNYGHCGAQSIHDEHHRTSRGNYGLFVMDRVLGTIRAPVVGARQRARDGRSFSSPSRQKSHRRSWPSPSLGCELWCRSAGRRRGAPSRR